MGQKVNPISFRICNGNDRVWSSNWFAKKKSDYVNNVISDLKIQEYFVKNASKYAVGVVDINRKQNKTTQISLQSGKISLVIGKNGENIAQIEGQLKKELNGENFSFNVKEARHSELNANIVARSIADKIENRQSFKRATKSAMEQVMKLGAAGIKVSCAGRLNGAEIARTEKFKNGVIPLHTLRADVDYAYHVALTTYGTIGIKVWICTKR